MLSDNDKKRLKEQAEQDAEKWFKTICGIAVKREYIPEYIRHFYNRLTELIAEFEV